MTDVGKKIGQERTSFGQGGTGRGDLAATAALRGLRKRKADRSEGNIGFSCQTGTKLNREFPDPILASSAEG
jgi:hypothetical protein